MCSTHVDVREWVSALSFGIFGSSNVWFLFLCLYLGACWLLQDNMVKSNIDKKFSAHYDAVEAELKSSTVGKYVWQFYWHCLKTLSNSKQWCLLFAFFQTFCSSMSETGLVTLNDMKAKQEALVKEREKQLAKKEQSKELQLWVNTFWFKRSQSLLISLMSTSQNNFTQVSRGLN